MARPKKVTPATEVASEPALAEETPQVEAVPMNDAAYSFHKSSRGWEVTRILFDAETKSVGQLEILNLSESEAEAVGTFKVTVARELMMKQRKQSHE